MAEAIEVTDNRAESQYEASIDGALALVAYQLRDDAIVFLHTEVPRALEGRGIGGQLAKIVIEDAKARGLAIVPRCPFIRAYIDRHPEYEPLVQAPREEYER